MLTALMNKSRALLIGAFLSYFRCQRGHTVAITVQKAPLVPSAFFSPFHFINLDLDWLIELCI